MALTIKPLLLGKLIVNFSLKTYMMNFDKQIWLPNVSWYIQVKGKHLLVDTGAPAAIVHKYGMGEAMRRLRPIRRRWLQFRFRPSKSIWS